MGMNINFWCKAAAGNSTDALRGAGPLAPWYSAAVPPLKDGPDCCHTELSVC